MIRKNKMIIILAILFIAVFVVTAFTSCAVKRDCQGTKHIKQKGGYYL